MVIGELNRKVLNAFVFLYANENFFYVSIFSTYAFCRNDGDAYGNNSEPYAGDDP